MHSSFEPLLLQIKASSYQSTSNLPYNIQASNPSSPKKPPKNPLSQTLQSFSQKRNRQQSAPSRTAKRKTTLAKSNGKDSSLNFNTTSFLKLFLKNPKETSQENSIQKLSNKLQAFKAPINTVITLEDLALRRRQTNKDGNNMYRNQNQSMDGKLNMQVHRSDKDITIRLDGHTSFQEYNPNESPISDDNTVGKLDRRARTADRFRRQGDMNYTMNETFEVSRETKAVDLSLTQTDKVFKKVTNGSRKGKDFANLSMEMNNTTNSSKKASTAYGIAFGRRGINLDLTREKSQNKTRLDTLNDSCEGSVEKVSTKRKEPPKRFDVYHQIATEEERERMYKFLKDDFVNEMLMNRFCVDMDKFQIRDAINDINKKVNQDKLLRKKFQDFLKNGVIKAPMPAEKRKEHGKKTSFLDIGPPRRKNSETYAPEVSADPISVIDGHEEEPKSKNTRKSREAVMDLLRVKGREGLTVAPIELRKKTHSPQEAMRSARTNSREDELLSSKDSKDDEEYRREMHKIRLMEMKKKLNYKFNKGGSKSDIDETTPTGPMLGSKSFLDQEGSHSFIKAVKNGDCKAIKKFLDSNPALASTCDLMKQSALHWAAKEGHLQACQILVEAGANVNALDMADKTPLYYALKEKYPAIVKFLLSCETGALSIKAATYGSLGEGIELLETLKQAQPIVAVQPPNKVNAQKNAKYSIRVAPPPRRDSKMAIKLIGLNKTQESII